MRGRVDGGLEQRLEQTLDDVLEQSTELCTRCRTVVAPGSAICCARMRTLLDNGPGGELVPLVHRAAVH